MRLLPLLLLFTSCYLHAPLEEPSTLQPVPSSEPTSAPADSLEPSPLMGGTTARVHWVKEECSNAGGLHIVLEILGREGEVTAIAHAGGHMYDPLMRICKGDVYNVVYVPTPKKFKLKDGWCLDGLPVFNGGAEILSLVKSAQDIGRNLKTENQIQMGCKGQNY